MELIRTGAELAALARALAEAEWVALDTEFMRERTYYARLCLIQFATPQWLALVDPLALADLSALLAALGAPRPLKVLHAARQDLEVFHDLGGAVPAPLFDTQIAAALLGYDDQIGYGALVQELLGVRLEKGATRTDWAARPLTAEQLRYAQDDVRYLCQLYPRLNERLAARGRLAWLEEECARLADPALYRSDPARAWRRIKSAGRLPAAAQARLRALAAWRERTARAKNLPRGWVLRDASLLELARAAPRTPAALAALPELEPQATKRFAAEILECLAAVPPEAPPAIEPEPAPLEPAERALVQSLLAELKALAEAEQLSPALLATRAEVEALVRGRRDLRLLQGWRAALAGARLTARLATTAGG
jgi:ribonuclease D